MGPVDRTGPSQLIGGIVLALCARSSRQGEECPPTNRTSHYIGMLLGQLLPARPRTRPYGRMTPWSWLGSASLFWTCFCTILALGWFPAHEVCCGLETDKRTNMSCEQATPLESLSLPSLQHHYHKA